MSFTIYNLEEHYMYQEYLDINVPNENEVSNELSNEISNHINEDKNLLIGYTPINIKESRLVQFFMKTNNDLNPINLQSAYTDTNVIRLPGKAIINKITAINIKGGLIPENTPTKIIGIFSKNGTNISNIFFGSYLKGVNLTQISLSAFNNIVIGNNVADPVDETYIFSIYTEYLQEPYDQYQLQITIDYTLL
jgi:hypothetical protein